LTSEPLSRILVVFFLTRFRDSFGRHYSLKFVRCIRLPLYSSVLKISDVVSTLQDLILVVGVFHFRVGFFFLNLIGHLCVLYFSLSETLFYRKRQVFYIPPALIFGLPPSSIPSQVPQVLWLLFERFCPPQISLPKVTPPQSFFPPPNSCDNYPQAVTSLKTWSFLPADFL